MKFQSWWSVEDLAAYRCYCHVSYTRHRVCATADKQQAHVQEAESKCKHLRCQLPLPCLVTSAGNLLLSRFTEVNWAGIVYIVLHINENADFELSWLQCFLYHDNYFKTLSSVLLKTSWQNACVTWLNLWIVSCDLSYSEEAADWHHLEILM